MRLVLPTNRSVKQVAEEIGVKESTLGNWLHRHRESHQGTVPAQPQERGPVPWDEHRKALAENERLKAEVEFLGKVSGFFFSHLKTEFYHHQRFGSRIAARTAVMDYIEGWYNRRRPNRRAGGVPPATAHANHHTSAQQPLAAYPTITRTVSRT